MKKLGLVLALLSLTGAVYGNCGNDNGNGNGCSDVQGPAGPQGLPGSNGTNGNDGLSGSNGVDGTNGVNGKDGRDGRDGRDMTAQHEHAVVLDTAVRLYDGKRIQIQAFNVYRVGAKPSQDLIGNGYNMMVGARVIFKLGSSYEEREIARLRKQLGLK